MFKKIVLCGFLHKKNSTAFSLVEMLMALLVASLLLAALAPVMTKRMQDTYTIKGTLPTEKVKKHEITYGSEYCNVIKTDSDGSQYCEGTFTVPAGYNGVMKVTVIGAGGGGGTAPTAGFVEYTAAGNSYEFKIPAMVGKIYATLIAGGQGGGPGGQVLTNKDWLTGGTFNWDVPAAARSKYVLVTACGGGGGGGGAYLGSPSGVQGAAGGGGSGGYRVNAPVQMGAQSSANIFIGGGGGYGGGDDSGSGGTGRPYGGGGGGHEAGTASRVSGSAPGGAGGYSATNTATGMLNALGGTGAANASIALNNWGGGAGSTGGPGGSGGGINEWLASILDNQAATSGGGGGGPEGGGGGGGSSAGSGGGGGGATILKQNGATLFNIGGGGGGAGTAYNISVASGNSRSWTGGGGGGGVGGGAGGGGGYTTLYGRGGQGGVNGANNLTGGKVNTVWGGNYCTGGNGGVGSTTIIGSNGMPGYDGAMRISYLSYGTGGSGGGSGRVYADMPLTVVPNETLKVVIGAAGKGGTPGTITNTGAVQNPVEPACAVIASNIQRNNVVVIGDAINRACGGGSYPGSSKGIACGPHVSPYTSEGGWIYSSLGSSWPVNGGMSATVPAGYFSTNGRPAGDGPNLNCNPDIIGNASSGGRGGTVTTPYTGTCTPGAAGTSASPVGGNASGYGCGGGGGYGLFKGGDGSSGYGRIYWNQIWDNTKKEYKLSEGSSAGGGASGNILTYKINVKSGEIIKVKIGKGGAGAKVVNNVVVEAVNGGNTEFSNLKAGGGKAGKSPQTDADGKVTNGNGGDTSATCHLGLTSYLNNAAYCTVGKKGSSGGNIKGGDGGALDLYGVKGSGGVQDVGDNSNGQNASGVNAGGGGAAIRNVGKLASPSLSAENITKGGDGANGKIMLEWYE